MNSAGPHLGKGGDQSLQNEPPLIADPASRLHELPVTRHAGPAVVLCVRLEPTALLGSRGVLRLP